MYLLSGHNAAPLVRITRSTQEHPRSSHEHPGAPQEHPGAHPGASRSTPGAPRSTQEHSNPFKPNGPRLFTRFSNLQQIVTNDYKLTIRESPQSKPAERAGLLCGLGRSYFVDSVLRDSKVTRVRRTDGRTDGRRRRTDTDDDDGRRTTTTDDEGTTRGGGGGVSGFGGLLKNFVINNEKTMISSELLQTSMISS